MSLILNFFAGGGLLALVQAALSFWSMLQAKQSGVNETVAKSDTKVIGDAVAVKQVQAAIATLPVADVDNQLRDFTRAD